MKLLLPFALIALQAISSAAYSQATSATYPNRPVTLVVPFAPGGGTDIGARLTANKLTQKWGQSVVVDNKGGAGGVLGADIVAKAKADGYTLLFGNVGTQSINPALYKKLPYNFETAFAPVSLVAELPFFLMTSPSFAPKTVKELIVYAKANPDKVTYASSGNGGSPHLSAEVFSAMAGVRMTHVPTIAEGGMDMGLAGYESGSWIGILAPTGTPQAIINKIASDVKEALSHQETKDAFAKQGANPVGGTPAQFKALIDADLKRYTKIIQEKNISID